ncbi:VOC family protein, partial [Saccharopolyspora terrae]|uniref:VOC family protein n=1 Tax=Saccharopolyspora terrae TaxID=2530384 RepID=UPI0038B6327B
MDLITAVILHPLEAYDPAVGGGASPSGGLWREDGLVRISLVSLVVDDYDRAIAFFVGVLGFELVEDSPSLTNDGREKRWVVVRPPEAGTGILLAQADGE